MVAKDVAEGEVFLSGRQEGPASPPEPLVLHTRVRWQPALYSSLGYSLSTSQVSSPGFPQPYCVYLTWEVW